MAYQAIGIGSSANDGTGDDLRTAGDKVNDNFVEIYTLLGTGSALSSGISATSSVVTLTAPLIATSLNPSSANGATLGSASAEWSDLYLADGGVIYLGADQDVRIIHDADDGLLLKTSATADDNPFTLILQTGETDLDANDIIGSLSFQAPDEVSEGDSRLVSASVDAVAEGTFSATNNATKLSFKLGVSETATEKMSLSSAGLLTIADDLVIGDGKTIGSSSDPDAITISSGGVVTFSQSPNFGLDLTIEDDLFLDSDAAVVHFGEDGDVTLTHVADTGLLLNSTMALQFNDASQFINAPSATVLDINATDEIELNATLLDVNANINASGTYTGAGLMTTGGNIVIPDAGTIGSASDTDAMSISSGGVVNFSVRPTFAASVTIQDGGSIGSASDLNAVTISSGGVVAVTATTASTNATSGALTVAGGVGIAADLSVGDDVRLLSDAAVISFGADSDVTLTHVADTGLLLNSTMALQFNDASQFINAPTNAILDINATDEIELNATLVDINGNVEISGTAAQVGVATFTARPVFSGGITIANAGQIGSAGDLDAIAIASDGVVTFSQAPVFAAGATLTGSLGISTSLNPDASDGATLGTTALEWSDLYLADGAQILFGDDQEVTLTHVADTGLLLNGTNQLQFNDSSQFINAPTNAILDITATDEIELNATLIDVNGNLDVSGTLTQTGVATFTATPVFSADVTIEDDLFLDSDAAVIHLGEDGDVTLTHVADTGLLLNSTMQLQFNDASQYINAPSATVLDINATDEIELNATLIDVNGNLDVSGTGVIAGAVTTAALTASGVIKTDDTTAATNTTDGSLQTDGGLSVVLDAVIGDDLFMLSDAAVITFGADKDVTLTHVADTGILLNSTSAIQFNDASQFINAPTNAILDINATDEIELNATLIDVNGNLDVSGTLTQTGVATFTATPVFSADVIIEDDLFLDSDAAVIHLGEDGDVTLTHVADTGILLNSTMAIQFNDASQFINAPTNAILDINATDEIELNATLLDVNANINASGTYTGAGTMTTGGNIVIPDAGTIGSASDADALAIGSDGDITLTQDLELQHDGAILSFGANDEVTLTHVHDTGLLLNSTMAIQFNDASQYINAPSNAILDINATDEIELNATLVDVNANLDVSGTYQGGGTMTTGGNIVIPDAGTIGSASDTNAISISSGGVVAVTATTASSAANNGALTVAGGAGIAADLSIGDDLRFLSDASLVSFGANSEITLTHVHDVGLTLTHTSTADNTPIVLQLKSEEDAIIANEVIASLEFAAGDSDGTDGATVAAGIHAIAEDTFSASVNKTKLVFTTGVSETAASSATAKATLSSIGDFQVAGDLVIKDGGLIGSASDLDALSISSGGVVNFTARPTFAASLTIQDGGSIGSASDLNAVTISSGGVVAVTASTASTNATSGALTVAGGAGIAADLSVGDDLRLISDAAVLGFGADGDVTLTHVADTGLLLNSTMAIQFNDASQYINAPSNAILDINATDEIELNATLLDVNANINASGTYTGAGLMTTGGNIVIPDAGYIGSASDTDAIQIEADGDVVFTQDVAVAGNLTVTGTTTQVDTVTMEAANAVVFEGATADDHETTLTIIDPTADRTQRLLNQSGFIPLLAAVTTTAITSTPEELNILDGATVVVGEINALDIGSTAVGTAVASKAVILDSNKDYTGIRNLTISGEIDAATGDYSGAVDIAGATTTAAITASGIIKTDDTTAATSTTDGSLQTDGGLSVAADAVIGDDLFLLSDAAVLTFGADKDVTVTHVADAGIMINAAMQLRFRDSAISIGSPADGDLDINADDEIELNSTLIDVNGNLDVSGTFTGAGLMTTGGNIVIPDAGNIGAASDTDSIAIASDGVVTFSQAPVFPDGSIAVADLDIDGATDIGAALVDADLFIVDDGAGGANRKSTLARIKTYINASASGSVNADDVAGGDAAVLITTSSGNITLDAAANNTDIIFKGTDGGSDLVFLTLDGSEAGEAIFNAGIVVGDAGNIGSASDKDAIAIGSDGDVTLTQDLELQHDGAILSFGANDDVSLTHVHDTGLLLNAAMAIQFRDSAISIGSTADGDLSIAADDEIDITSTLIDINGNVTISGTTGAAAVTTSTIVASGIIKTDDSTAATSTTDGSLQTDGGLSVVLDAVIGDDIILISDAAQIAFGVNSDVTLKHVHNVGLTATHVGTGDNLPMVLQLKSEEDALVANEVIASLEFAAGDSGGTDGSTVAAGIHAIAEGAFTASANATKLVFTTGVSETAASSATAKATLSSIGDFTVAGDLIIKDGGLIGSASDLDAIAIASDGVVTFSQALVTTGITIGSTAVSSTAAELNALDGITAVVGELNALDIGSTAIGTAVASKAVILDSNKDYTGIRNLTISGELDAATLDISGAIDIAGATATAAITASGIIKTDDTTAATSTTDGSLQTDGGLSVAADAVIGDDLFLLSDLAVLTFGADKDVTLTHAHNTGLMLNAAMILMFRDNAINIGSPADGDLDINADDEIELNSTLIDINGNVEISGTTAAAAMTMSTIVASGIIKTDDTTNATTATDGSLQTDGGLSVVLDAVFGDDVTLMSDSSVLSFGTNSDIRVTHVHDTGLTITNVIADTDNRPIVFQLKSEEDAIVANDVIASLEFAAGDSDGTDGAVVAAGIHAIAEDTFSASVNKTKLVFTTGVSETAASSATAKATLSSIGDFTIAGDLIIKDGGTIGSASDLDAMAIASNGVVTFSQIPVMPANSIDSDEYIDGSIDRAHLSADIIDGTKIADDAIDSEHYTDASIDNAHIADDAIDSEHYAAGSIDTAHIADSQITQAKMADDSVGSAEMKTLSTLLIKNSGGTTLKTLHGAGA